MSYLDFLRALHVSIVLLQDKCIIHRLNQKSLGELICKREILISIVVIKLYRINNKVKKDLFK